MSFNIELKKDIEIDIQIDFIKCNGCNKDLDATVDSDSFGDLQIYVDKCDCKED